MCECVNVECVNVQSLMLRPGSSMCGFVDGRMCGYADVRICGCADWLSRREFLWELIGKSHGMRRAPLTLHPTRSLAERNAQVVNVERVNMRICRCADVRMCGLAFETGVSLGIDW